MLKLSKGGREAQGLENILGWQEVDFMSTERVIEKQNLLHNKLIWVLTDLKQKILGIGVSIRL